MLSLFTHYSFVYSSLSLKAAPLGAAVGSLKVGWHSDIVQGASGVSVGNVKAVVVPVAVILAALGIHEVPGVLPFRVLAQLLDLALVSIAVAKHHGLQDKVDVLLHSRHGHLTAVLKAGHVFDTVVVAWQFQADPVSGPDDPWHIVASGDGLLVCHVFLGNFQGQLLGPLAVLPLLQAQLGPGLVDQAEGVLS